MSIRITVRAVDGFRKSRSFKTQIAARRFAVRHVGESPELGRGYAVSFDGVATVTCNGLTLRELFVDREAVVPYRVRHDATDLRPGAHCSLALGDMGRTVEERIEWADHEAWLDTPDGQAELDAEAAFERMVGA